MNELVTQQRAVAIAQSSQRASLLDIRRNPMSFPRIKDYAPEALLMELKSSILMVYQYRGMRPNSADEIKVMAQSLMAELLADDFGNDTRELSMEEIRRALRKVGLRQGADMYGINVGSLYNAIQDFRNTEVEDARQKIAAERRSSDKVGCSHDAIIDKYAAMMRQAAKERGDDTIG